MNNFVKKIFLFFKNHYLIAFVFYFLVTLFVFKDKLPYVFSHYGMPDIDTEGTIWYQWFLLFNKRNNESNYLTNLIGYPFGYDLSTSPFSNFFQSLYLQIMLIFNLSSKNIISIFNISSYSSFVFSAFAFYCFSFYLSKNKLASFLGGIAFSFSFYHILQSRGQMSNLHWEFIPFYFLYFFKYLDFKKNKDLFLSVFFFSLMFSSFAYYAFFSGVFSVLIFFVYYRGKDKLKVLFKYYFFIFLFLILTNLNFVLSNLYMFTSSGLSQSGRLHFEYKLTIIKFKSLFSFAKTNIFNKVGFGEHPIGFVLLISSFLFSLLRKDKNNKLCLSILICFIFSIALSSTIVGFSWLRIFYFKFFSMFRSVAFLIIFIIFFASLLFSFFLKFLLEKVKNKQLRFIFLIILFFLLIGENLNNNKTFRMITSISNIENLYSEIKEDSSVKNIAVYPNHMNFIKFGFPTGYQEMGQIFHEKKVVTGASPFDKHAQDFQSKIRDLSNNKTINILSNNGVDGILIYNKYMDNSLEINHQLKNDSRLIFIGDYESKYDQGILSAINNSKNISFYKIKNPVYKKLVYTSNDNALINFKKINQNKYEVELKNIGGEFSLYFDYPYSHSLQLKNNFFSAPVSPNLRHNYSNSWIINDKIFNGEKNIKLNIYFNKGMFFKFFSNLQIISYIILIYLSFLRKESLYEKK